MVFADILSESGPIVIEADIVLAGEGFMKALQDSCVDMSVELEKVRNAASLEKAVFQNDINRLNKEKEALQERIDKNDELIRTLDQKVRDYQNRKVIKMSDSVWKLITDIQCLLKK
jgi:uncharacterized protein YlxW (UPF0749 family)